MSEKCGSRLKVEQGPSLVLTLVCNREPFHDLRHSDHGVEWATTDVIRKRVGRGLDAARPPLIDDTKRRRQGTEVQDRAPQHRSPVVTKKDGSR